MSGTDEEDEALTWAGGRDPSHYETPEAKIQKPGRPVRTRSGTDGAATADDAADEEAAGDEAADDDEDEARPAMSGAVLVCLGVLGGIYALYTVGWFVSWQRLLHTDPNALALAAFHVEQVLAIVASPLWFVVTLLFTRDRRPSVRLLWLIIGALLLVPWPFTFGQ